ncbi:MAG: RNA polymerase sigma factor [Hyphomonadaceae bacterium]
MGPADDLRLVLRARAGDLEAFERLVRALEPVLRRYVGRIVGTRALTDDVLQEAFLRIWRGLGWLREPALFRAWTYRIATREAHRLLRRERKHEEPHADACELEALAAPFADPAARLDLESTMMRISPLARTVIAAHYFEGLTLEEVAAATETPVGTVKSRLASGLKQARGLLEPAL